MGIASDADSKANAFPRFWETNASYARSAPQDITPPATPSPRNRRASFMANAQGLKELSVKHSQRASLSMHRAANVIVGAVRPAERSASLTPPDSPASTQSPLSRNGARRDSMWSAKRRRSGTPSLRSLRGFVSNSVADLSLFSRSNSSSTAGSDTPTTTNFPPQSLPSLQPMSTLTEDLHTLSLDTTPRQSPATPQSPFQYQQETYDPMPGVPIMSRPVSRFGADNAGLFATMSQAEQGPAMRRRSVIPDDSTLSSTPLSVYAASFRSYEEAQEDVLCLPDSRKRTSLDDQKHERLDDHFRDFSAVSRNHSYETVQHAPTDLPALPESPIQEKSPKLPDTPSFAANVPLPATPTPSFAANVPLPATPTLPATPSLPATPTSAPPTRAGPTHSRAHSKTHSRHQSYSHSRNSSRSYSFPGPSHNHARHVSSTSTIGSTFSFRSGDSSPRLLEANAVHVQHLPSPRTIEFLGPPRFRTHARLDSRSSLQKEFTMQFPAEDEDVDATPLASATGTLKGHRRLVSEDFDPFLGQDDAASFALSTGFWETTALQRRPSEPTLRLVPEARLDGPFDPAEGWY